ncbi:MAG: hypothetical protein J7577_12575 [Sphingobacteriaceae bacterium]|nr:hypothetical protein [Sphingobacteriaceae bacterium]
MKRIILFCLAATLATIALAQKAPVKDPVVPCNGDADHLPGKYTDHTNPKYPSSLKGTAPDKAVMTRQLIALEKLEEASRNNFQLNGCVARVSFSGGDKTMFGNIGLTRYGYQLAAYQNVCHVTEHIVKTVGEYRTVLRVDVNPSFVQGYLLPGGTGEFYLDKSRAVRYDIPIDAKQGPNYSNERTSRPSRISQYISEAMILANRSNDYKNKHADFLKFINGEDYVENWISGSKYDKIGPKSYQWIDRRYLIAKPGIPVLIPVSRKQYLEDLLEYFEIEKANFYFDLENKIKNNAGNTSESGKKRATALEADKNAYPQLYETKKAKVKELLATQKAEWLQKQAVIDINSVTYDANERLAAIGKFYDAENEKTSALYIYNPAYFKPTANQPTKPALMEVQFRYEISADRGFSERLLSNFLKNYDLNALRKMLD